MGLDSWMRANLEFDCGFTVSGLHSYVYSGANMAAKAFDLPFAETRIS
jgi:hypothetical protein